MTRKIWLMGLLVGITALSACGEVRDFRRGMPLIGSNARTPAPAAPASPAMGTTPAASDAETACMRAGSDAGFSVQGVAGTREVSGADGMAASRDVMLQVDRGGQTIEVRCSYDYANASARIMTL
ncbi:hypothetical protein JI664_00265 [Rhodobacter sp. NTK016B]|uniref:hypothetical protein n=1 Tax=Rhodobacter sp. NTK016B TaxID=2759676 RepID=UPI001A8D6DEA|nr:hypothetical protein [Rhodobacter sp. NTK016B]MBN8290389.1 hypothetical protein [Rhodobacter sp. NTK016B]